MFASPARADAPLNYLTSHSDRADAVLHLTWGVMGISVVVMAAIGVLLTVSIWRRPGLAEPQPGMRLAVGPREGGLSWLWIGVGVSGLALLATVVWTVDVLAGLAEPAEGAPFTIEVTGHQWWWHVRYLSDDPSRIFTTANEIHIPTGVPVRFKLASGDVIHSFWVPALSGKTDLIPGQTNELWLEARDAGTYRGQCAEYCGIEHARMGLIVVAQSPAAFRTWWDHQLQSPAPPPDASAMQSFDMRCGSCHAVRGTAASGVLGPDLSHLMQRKTIAAGLLANTERNRLHWIDDPQAIKPGSLMPAPELTPHELAVIDGYLETLR
ncbi:MAG: cytochrome c oxidase subunit II [Proteobacteria bacterium]|nr:cytochrome c oxidase subunit II [Pseudomonadota bacterium]